jgi:hypothetical protein
MHALNLNKGQATIFATLVNAGKVLRVEGEIRAVDADARRQTQASVAVFEQSLSTRVTRGENASGLLDHDFVVPVLRGPFRSGALGEPVLGRLQQIARCLVLTLARPQPRERPEEGRISGRIANRPSAQACLIRPRDVGVNHSLREASTTQAPRVMAIPSSARQIENRTTAADGMAGTCRCVVAEANADVKR